MTHISIETINTSLQAVPVALAFSKRMLLADKPMVGPVPVESQTKDLAIRATKLTELLKNIEGYDHGGLNE